MKIQDKDRVTAVAISSTGKKKAKARSVDPSQMGLLDDHEPLTEDDLDDMDDAE